MNNFTDKYPLNRMDNDRSLLKNVVIRNVKFITTHTFHKLHPHTLRYVRLLKSVIDENVADLCYRVSKIS